jgi:hypothetical protein
MKYIIFIIICFLLSCHAKEKDKVTTTCVSVIGDKTDPHIALPLANPILSLYQFDKSPNSEAWFRFKAIKDVKLVPLVTYHLASTQEMPTDSDPQFRSRAIKNFYGQIRNTIEQFREATKTQRPVKNSECYSVIHEELTHLAIASYDTKKLLVFSDLFEKSFLNLSTQAGITSDKLATMFEKEAPLPKRLDDIEVTFVFSPKSREEDKRFTITVGAYKRLLMVRGATVAIQADATFFK